MADLTFLPFSKEISHQQQLRPCYFAIITKQLAVLSINKSFFSFPASTLMIILNGRRNIMQQSRVKKEERTKLRENCDYKKFLV
jgi:hypothetical protein